MGAVKAGRGRAVEVHADQHSPKCGLWHAACMHACLLACAATRASAHAGGAARTQTPWQVTDRQPDSPCRICGRVPRGRPAAALHPGLPSSPHPLPHPGRMPSPSSLAASLSSR
eukprot:353289-Chlamydomonas_euryale.AAC.5